MGWDFYGALIFTPAMDKVGHVVNQEVPAREPGRGGMRNILQGIKKGHPNGRPFSRYREGLALNGLGHFCGEIFFHHFDAFAHFKAHKICDLGTGLFGGGLNRQVRVHHKSLTH